MTQPLLDRLVRWAEATGWTVTPGEGKPPGGSLLLEAESGDGYAAVVLLVDEDGERVVLYSMLEDDIPSERRQAVGEVVLRANRGLLSGAFELDLDDGDFRFRTNIEIATEVSDDQLAALMNPVLIANITTFNVYLPAVAAVVNNEMSPAEAVRSAEADAAEVS